MGAGGAGLRGESEGSLTLALTLARARTPSPSPSPSPSPNQVIGGIATFPQGRHELCACGAPTALLAGLIAPPELPEGISPADYTAPIVPLELQAEAALVLTRCAEAAAARSQLLASGGVPRLVRRLQLHVPLLDEPVPAKP